MRAMLVAASLLAAAPAARADSLRPPALRDIGVEESLGQRVPLELPFVGEGGAPVRLGDYFEPGRPVILVLAYSKCPMLCSLILRAARDAVRQLDQGALAPGRDYQVVTVSIDPSETPELAAETRAGIERRLAESGWDGEWPVLVGDAESIDRLTSRVGFRYTRDPRSGQYAHPAVLTILTGEGVVNRYLYGTRFEPEELASSLLAAAAAEPQASIGSSVLSCFRFTGALSKYGDRIQLAFRIGAATIFAALLVTLALLFRWERRRR